MKQNTFPIFYSLGFWNKRNASAYLSPNLFFSSRLKRFNNWLPNKFNSSCLLRALWMENCCACWCRCCCLAALVLARAQRSFDLSVCLLELCWHLCVCVCVCARPCVCLRVALASTERSAGRLEHAGSFPQSRQHSVPNEFSSGRAFALGHNHKAYCYRHKRGERGMEPVNGDKRYPSRMRISERDKKEVTDTLLNTLHCFKNQPFQIWLRWKQHLRSPFQITVKFI